MIVLRSRRGSVNIKLVGVFMVLVIGMVFANIHIENEIEEAYAPAQAPVSPPAQVGITKAVEASKEAKSEPVQEIEFSKGDDTKVAEGESESFEDKEIFYEFPINDLNLLQ